MTHFFPNRGSSYLVRELIPVAELVVDVAAVVLREQAGALEQVHAPRVGAKCVAQRGEAVGRIADRELLADRLVHAAAVEIRARLVAAGQVLAEEMRRGFQRAEQLLGVGILVAMLSLARQIDEGEKGEVV